jgi:hypothetical protein
MENHQQSRLSVMPGAATNHGLTFAAKLLSMGKPTTENLMEMSAFHQLSRTGVRTANDGFGAFAQFPPTSLSVGYRIGQRASGHRPPSAAERRNRSLR